MENEPKPEAKQATLTENDLVEILRDVVEPEKVKRLNMPKYRLGDKIGAYLAEKLSYNGIHYKYMGFMGSDAPLFTRIIRDPDYLIVTNFAVDTQGYFEPEKVSLFQRVEEENNNS